MAKKRKLAAKPEPSDTAAGTATNGDGPSEEEAIVEYKPEVPDDVDAQEPIKSLLDPLNKEQLIDLLSAAAEAHADVMEEVRRVADVDPVHRKVFVHGLGWDTTAETVVSAFREHGEIEDCNLVVDKATGKSKGYAFILFKSRGGARRAISKPQKKIGQRMTACQMASLGPVGPPPPPVSEYTQRKIFVSNVGESLDPQKLLGFFARYGEIEEGPLGLDKLTGKPRGFALFVYKTVESARKALEEPHKSFEGHVLHCQKAVDGPKLMKQGWGQQHQSWGVQNQGVHFGVGGGAGGSDGKVSQFSRAGDNVGFVGGFGGPISPSRPGHLMAPSGGGLGFNQGNPPVAAGINPALGQALTSLLTTPAAGLGLTNILGSLGSAGIVGSVGNQGMPAPIMNSVGHGMQGGYGNQPTGVGANMNTAVLGGYGGQSQVRGGYGPPQMGPGTAGRGQVGYMGGLPPYTGR